MGCFLLDGISYSPPTILNHIARLDQRVSCDFARAPCPCFYEAFDGAPENVL